MRKLERYCRAFFDTIAYRRKSELGKDDTQGKLDLLCLDVALGRFLKEPVKENAFEVFFCFCEIFKPFGSGYGGECEKILSLLNSHEESAGALAATQRDHYAHSVLVFAMGLAIYASNGKYRKAFSVYRESGARVYQNERVDFLFAWGIASLFHDVGYPYELAFSQIREYKKQMGDAMGGEPPYPEVCFDGLEAFENMPQGQGRFAERFAKIAAETFDGELAHFSELIHSLPRGKKHVDHAYFSAGILFSAVKWDKIGDENAVNAYMGALFAILLHNQLARKLCGDTWFQTAHGGFACEKTPLGWLLLVTDALQDYGRSCFGRNIRAENYSSDCLFDIDEGKLGVQYQCYDVESARVPTADGVAFIKFEEIFDVVEFSKAEKKSKPRKILYSDKKFFVQILETAIGLSERYNELYGGPKWEELTLEYKLSNIEVAKLYAEKLHSLRYFFTKERVDLRQVRAFARGELAGLSRAEHERWVQEKKAMRWTYDPKAVKKDEKRRTHPDLRLEKIKDKKLRKFEADKDGEVIAGILDILRRKDYKIYRLP